MSFTGEIKTEISKQKYNKLEKLSLLSGIIRNEIQEPNIRIQTENKEVASLIFNLFQETYKIIPKITVRKLYNYNKNLIYLIDINKKQEIIEDLGIKTIIPNNYIIDDDNLVRAYIKGVFLAKGSINDPKTSRYHMEIVVDNQKYSETGNFQLEH